MKRCSAVSPCSLCAFASLAFALLASGCANSSRQNANTSESPVPDATTGVSLGSGRFDSIPDGEKAQATFAGGDGSSIQRAVIFDSATEKTGIRAEYIWLHEHYPGYRPRSQRLRNENGRLYDEMRIITSDGKSQTEFFDITLFFGKYHAAVTGSRTVNSFQFIGPTTTIQDLYAAVGREDRDFGSGLTIYEYRLSDGSYVWIGSTSRSHIIYVRHGKTLDQSELLYPKL